MKYMISSRDVSPDYGIDTINMMVLQEKGYKFATGPFRYDVKHKDEIIQKLKDAFCMNFYPTVDGFDEILLGTNCAVLFGAKKLVILAIDAAHLSQITNFVHPYLYNCMPTITYFYFNHGSVDTEQVPTEENETIYPELYPTIDIAKLREQFSVSNERILILYGEPGVGKTTFIRYLLKDSHFKRIAYIKDSKVLTSSEFWFELTDSEYDLVIFDDLDDILQSRKNNEKAAFVTNLLSYTDGVIRRKTKIVITTNQEIKEIDPAIIRAGRCFDFLVLPALTREQAELIWINLLKETPETFAKYFSNASEITQASLISGHLSSKINNMERNYLKEGDRNYNISDKIKELGISSGDRAAGFKK